MELANKFEKLPSDMTFGVELEFTGGLTFEETQNGIKRLIELGLIREGWEVHSDSSVVDEAGKGAEIVSPPLCDDEQTKKELEIITEYIKKNGGVMGDKVGGHIHFGLQALGNDIEVIKNFFKLYSIFEPLLFKLSTGDLDHIRPGVRQYAIPMQKMLIDIIDNHHINNITELVSILDINIGANATHYGPYRYYGLNFQRLNDARRNMPSNMNVTEFLDRLFKGEHIEIEDAKGNKKTLSPTVEMRFRNGSSDADEILSGARMLGALFVKAHDKERCKEADVKNLYRHMKDYRKKHVFDKMIERYRQLYPGLPENEVLDLVFKNSEYGDENIDFNTFKLFMNIMSPEIDEETVKVMHEYYQGKFNKEEEKKKNNTRKSKIDELREIRNDLVLLHERTNEPQQEEHRRMVA